NPDRGAELVAAAGIVAKEPIARKAIPQCNITYMDGEEMRQALSGYLQVLFDREPSAVGGAMPGEDFYYIP
ncbi:MAG: ABC transporter substrate-binding protein, partial [Acetatifactor sp.]|nr:ABC transporter substrate-binding protein [Acetatifactor sp.]